MLSVGERSKQQIKPVNSKSFAELTITSHFEERTSAFLTDTLKFSHFSSWDCPCEEFGKPVWGPSELNTSLAA